MYNVIFRIIVECSAFGAITWVPFKDKENFDKQYNERMREWYGVVDQGVSKERAIELCSTPEATLVIVASKLRELNEIPRQL